MIRGTAGAAVALATPMSKTGSVWIMLAERRFKKHSAPSAVPRNGYQPARQVRTDDGAGAQSEQRTEQSAKFPDASCSQGRRLIMLVHQKLILARASMRSTLGGKE